MARDYAVFLRNNRTPSMAPLRSALSELGLTDVDSLGSSGNFVFCAPGVHPAVLEERISKALGAEALVRTRRELASIVANDPYAGRQGANMFLARRAVEDARDALRNASGPDGCDPVASGTTVYFVWPTRLGGRKSVINFERELTVTGTVRTSRVVAQVLDLMNR